jgi:hypothetical protein
VDSRLTVVLEMVLRDVQQPIDGHEVYDDMTLVVAKQ